MIDLHSAAQLLDFSSRIDSPQRAREQLEGSVAVHNLLDKQGVAYLADEVGMGKTYVALGAIALFRHLDPTFRIVVIAPRENIQRKWMKELRNFVAHNYNIADLRVKGLDNRPARRMVPCDSLLEFVEETSLDPDRDFFCRLTSFSLATGGRNALNADDPSVRRLRDGLRGHLPWIDDRVFDLRSKQAFKDNFAEALCCALPQFDLVVVDEAHNLKHGFAPSSAARNRVVGLAFGRDPSSVDHGLFPRYARRAKRLLLLSATPVEESYRHLWNQLDVFGFGGPYQGLCRPELSDDEKKQIVSRLLVRRVTTISFSGQPLTKNLYRREWRSGGVSTFDDPICVADPRQRLTVALVQKKVSELLASEKFNSSFQIGMLASFESFLETTKVKRANVLDDESTFDDASQTDAWEEREGIDVADVNRLARSYRRQFGAEMPHPKMDALVESLSRSWQLGEKALIFVRRVASVKELKRKLDERYDTWLLGRLRAELPSSVLSRFEGLVLRYQSEKVETLEHEQDLVNNMDSDRDLGGADTFFAWFFRGEGPKRVVSGANVQQRFIQRGTVLSTFFEDNYAAEVLACRPGEVEASLAAELGWERHAVRENLRLRSRRFLPRVKKLARADRFEAVQAAAIELLKDTPGPWQPLSKIIWEERFEWIPSMNPADEAPDIGGWLELKTFTTELRQFPTLRASLWPSSTSSDRRLSFRDQELRRQLLGAMARLGHSLIDFYVLVIRRLGTLDHRTRESGDEDAVEDATTLIEDYLTLLQQQQSQPRGQRPWLAYDELADAAKHVDLILDTNEPEARDKPLPELSKVMGRLLRAQQPVGGMSGQVNQTLVRQFRMPGYPLVLISTDLLQEGEDLHTFCSAVHHYGISWTPSSMEQRIGRIDRVRSHTERRITGLTGTLEGQDKLQVFFPHLRETVEVLQVRRVLDRMDVFLRLMHEGLIKPGREDSRISTVTEFQRPAVLGVVLDQPLRTSFPVKREHLEGSPHDILEISDEVASLDKRFHRLRDLTMPGLAIEWDDVSLPGCLIGTAKLPRRIQPFTLRLDLHGTRPRIRCVSPVGRVHPGDRQADIIESAWRLGARIGALVDEESGTYDLTVEEDVLLAADPTSDSDRFKALLGRVVYQADQLEQEYLPGFDHPLAVFRDDLQREIIDGR